MSLIYLLCCASQVVQWVNNLPASAGDTRDTGFISGSERSPEVGNGNPLQYSCLENSMDNRSLVGNIHGSQRVKRLNTHAYYVLGTI